LPPNPFHGYCTLAVCTPNHVGAKLEEGDWIIANSPKADEQRLIFAMKVSEILHFKDYFNDKRFEKKKPDFKKDEKWKVGDNMYFGNGNGKLQQVRPSYHATSEN